MKSSCLDVVSIEVYYTKPSLHETMIFIFSPNKEPQLKFSKMFSKSNTFDPNTDIPSLTNKIYIVTGGTAGIGFGITAHLLQHNPKEIHILSNKEEHASSAVEALQKYGDIGKIVWHQCNLSSLTRTDAVAKGLLQSLDRIDGLICNAGIGVGPFGLSEDGIESHMQINFISQFHLIMTLLPLLQKTPESRLVLQSSDLHRQMGSFGSDSKVSFENLEELNRDIGAMNLYNRSKFAQVLFVRAFHRRQKNGLLGFKGVEFEAPWTNATHPGAVKTDQQDQAVEAYGNIGKLGVMATRPFMKDPVDEGCRPVLFAATSKDVVREGIWGQYIVPDQKVTEPSKQARDEELQERLWELTIGLLEHSLGKLGYEA
jgi:WW domain-containing oxidoreductase